VAVSEHHGNAQTNGMFRLTVNSLSSLILLNPFLTGLILTKKVNMDFKSIDQKEFKHLFPVTDNGELAEKYKVKESTIRLWGSKLKLNKKIWLWSRHDENFVLKNYGTGRYTIEEIAKKIGRSKWSIINKYREASGKRKKKKS